jgi:hypothetical protein
MAYQEIVKSISLEASSDLSSSQYLFVDANSDGEAAVVSSAGAKAIGVLQNNPAAQGRAATVAVQGVVKVVAGAAIAKGAEIASSAAGKAATATSSQIVLGISMTDTTADSQIVSVLLGPTYVKA